MMIHRAACLLATLAASGCILVTDDGRTARFGPDEDCPRECINPFDESCWHAGGGCGHLDSDGDGLVDAREDQLGTDPQAADTDEDGVCDGAELDAGRDPLDPCA